jgi:tetratricopeptide (TPR) repeat protein
LVKYSSWSFVRRKTEGKPSPENERDNKAFWEYSRGRTYLEKGKYDEAIKHFRRALEIDPKHADAWYNLGLCYSGKVPSEPDKAEECFNRTLEIDPKHKGAWSNLGLVWLHQKGDVDKAIECYKKALEIDPESVEAWVSLGYVYEKLGKEKAQKCYEEAVGNLGRRLGYPQTKSQTGDSRTRESATGR